MQLGGGTYDELMSHMGRLELTTWKALFKIKQEEQEAEEKKASLGRKGLKKGR